MIVPHCHSTRLMKENSFAIKDEAILAAYFSKRCCEAARKHDAIFESFLWDTLMSIKSSDIAFTMGARGPLMDKVHSYPGHIKEYRVACCGQ